MVLSSLVRRHDRSFVVHLLEPAINRDMADFALQPLKNLNASHNRVLARERLSFELSRILRDCTLFIVGMVLEI